MTILAKINWKCYNYYLCLCILIFPIKFIDQFQIMSSVLKFLVSVNTELHPKYTLAMIQSTQRYSASRMGLKSHDFFPPQLKHPMVTIHKLTLWWCRRCLRWWPCRPSSTGRSQPRSDTCLGTEWLRWTQLGWLPPADSNAPEIEGKKANIYSGRKPDWLEVTSSAIPMGTSLSVSILFLPIGAHIR